MKNYIQPGEKITVPAPHDVASGGGVLVGSMFGVAATAAKDGEDVTIVRKGVFVLNKLTAQAWEVGVKVYWNNTAKEVTTVASGNTQIGFAAVAAADPSANGTVALI
jgi:predicted RecA/RadA family phage recombinase